MGALRPRVRGEVLLREACRNLAPTTPPTPEFAPSAYNNPAQFARVHMTDPNKAFFSSPAYPRLVDRPTNIRGMVSNMCAPSSGQYSRS